MDGDAKDSPGRKKSPGRFAVLIIAAIVLIILVSNSAYEIKEQEQAVLITLGRPQAVTEPGLHFKIPLIQQVRKVNTTIQGLTIGYNSDSNQSNEDAPLCRVGEPACQCRQLARISVRGRDDISFNLGDCLCRG